MYSVALVTAVHNDRRNMLRLYRRKLRDTTDPFSIPEQRFRDLYRLSRDAAFDLLNEISPHMSKGIKKTFIPQPIRMCSALHFFATGSFYRDIGQDFTASVSKSVVSRCVHEISDILESRLMATWIRFPEVSEYEAIKHKFYKETGFPDVIGAIDCTHVRIKKPSKEVEGCYLNRKGYYSKKVQLICDYNLKIFDGFAKLGGSTNDDYIWEDSHINILLQQRYDNDQGNNSWLLGDSGYPLRPWLVTPYISSTENEGCFNAIHSKARNCVERLKRELKRVFRCLEVGLHTTPQMAEKIINACTVIHNFRLEHGLIEEDNLTIPEEESESINEGEIEVRSREGYITRDRIKTKIYRDIKMYVNHELE